MSFHCQVSILVNMIKLLELNLHADDYDSTLWT